MNKCKLKFSATSEEVGSKRKCWGGGENFKTFVSGKKKETTFFCRRGFVSGLCNLLVCASACGSRACAVAMGVLACRRAASACACCECCALACRYF